MLMLRLKAHVISVKTIGKHIRNDGFQEVLQECNVKIKGPAKKRMKLPKGLKGQTAVILKKSVDPWLVKKDDVLILGPSQSKTIIKDILYQGNAPAIDPRDRTGVCNVLKRSVDIDLDGFNEDIIENHYLQATILPHYGARTQQIITRRTGLPNLFGTARYDKDDYIEFGGIEETIEGTFVQYPLHVAK